MPSNLNSNLNDKSTRGKGFGTAQQTAAPTKESQASPIDSQSAEQAKAIAQQTAHGLEQYLGHTGLDVLNQVRGAKHQITDAVSSAIAAEVLPGRIQAEVLTATMGKLQQLDSSCAKGFEWGYLPELPSVSALPLVDISHLFPASAQGQGGKALAASHLSKEEMAAGLDGNQSNKEG